MAEEKNFKKALTTDDVKVYIDSRVKAAYDKLMATPRTEVAEIQGWWNLLAVGPIQPIRVDGPFAPHQVIKIGEPAFVATLIVLNPFLMLPGGISAAHALSDFALPYEINYQAANISLWAPSPLGGVNTGNLVPGQFWYVDVHQFIPQQAGIHEMNILARILGAVSPGTAPHFAGFARRILDLDPEVLWPPSTRTWQFDLPIKFMAYP
ncbi:MAG TPA: hypothetical protein VLM83_10495 [Anaerolineales bacterium]|nr:hypothetical protein [Anaerolineales bacterium]